jgi:hypothetical protein
VGGITPQAVAEGAVNCTFQSGFDQGPREVVSGEGAEAGVGLTPGRGQLIDQPQLGDGGVVPGGAPGGPAAQEGAKVRWHLAGEIHQDVDLAVEQPGGDLGGMHQVQGAAGQALGTGRQGRGKVVVGDGEHIDARRGGAGGQGQRCQGPVRIAAMNMQVKAGFWAE